MPRTDPLGNSAFRNSKSRLSAGAWAGQNVVIRVTTSNFPNLRCETIPTRGHGFDVSRAVLPIPQYLAQDRDMLCKVRLFDEGIGPDLSQQFILFEQASSILNEGH